MMPHDAANDADSLNIEVNEKSRGLVFSLYNNIW